MKIYMGIELLLYNLPYLCINVASGHFVTFLGELFRAVHFAILIVHFVKSCPAIYRNNDGRTRLTLFDDHLNHLVGGM